MDLTPRERVTLAVIGLMALAGLGVLGWQQQRPPLELITAAAPAQAAQWNETLASSRTVDVNTADAAELERLPGVGPALARRIVEDRKLHGPFGAPEELTRVPGIGAKTVEALKDYFTVK